MNQELQCEYRLPNSFEVKLIQTLLEVPNFKDAVLENNGLKDVDYICIDCQQIFELSKYNFDKYDSLSCEAADMYEESYNCPCCNKRMVQLKTGDL